MRNCSFRRKGGGRSNRARTVVAACNSIWVEDVGTARISTVSTGREVVVLVTTAACVGLSEFDCEIEHESAQHDMVMVGDSARAAGMQQLAAAGETDAARRVSARSARTERIPTLVMVMASF